MFAKIKLTFSANLMLFVLLRRDLLEMMVAVTGTLSFNILKMNMARLYLARSVTLEALVRLVLCKKKCYYSQTSI